ncbi:MAG: hypothetical protein WC295_11450 [Methanoregula sp.]|nr:hypothetical protein [Methanoregula sp.]
MNNPQPILYLALLALLLVLALVFATGCIQAPYIPSGSPNPGTYAFIDHQVYIDGTTTNGTYPLLMIDFPTYLFDPERGVLEGLVTFEINQSLLLIYGSGTHVSGDCGSGASGMLHGGYSLPYMENGFVVRGFTTNGTVYLSYLNQTIALQAGERWTDLSIITETTPDYTITKTVTDTITYYGVFPVSEITATRLRP